MRRSTHMGLLLAVLASAAAFWLAAPRLAVAETAKRPNIIFILADDLAYADLGCYGQTKIKTPNLDRMAAEGIRFTSAYCGTSVCAPSRCALMTGLHMGHAPIRANREIKPEGQMPLPAGTLTVARLLKDAGYRTACIGKWGLGMVGTTGDPLNNGFDYFFGYNCQMKAHEYYPEYLWRNAEKVMLNGKEYSHDRIAADALGWLREHKDQPFFLYLPFTIPHSNYQVPDLGPYAAEAWPEVAKKYAAMITRMDGDIGRVFALLKELKLDENTIVFFASDNGAAGGQPTAFFQNTPWRGIKRSMYEGGLRVPMIVRWPNHVPPGKVNDQPWAFWDFLPTCAELAGQKLPAGVKVDGLSVLPAILGGQAPERECFYWELYEGRFQQGLRMGDWKAVRSGPRKGLELYDLKADPNEKIDLAAARPEVLAKAEATMKAARVDSPLWPTTLGIAKPKAPGAKAKAKGKAKAKAKASDG